MKYHLKAVRMAIIKKSPNNKSYRGCRGKGTLSALLVRMEVGVATMENSKEVPQKLKNRTTIQCIMSTPGYLSEQNKNLKAKSLKTKTHIF